MKHRPGGPGLALALAALLIGAMASAADAADDAGTRSVLSAGAGNRALALGSAYAALGDDAGVLLWNPAGLARVNRMQFEVMHDDNAALDLGEDFAAFALPSWRWGVAALAIHHFSVGGIERRDDRNVLLDPSLENSETEITLGYGKSMSDAVAVGGAVKLQRQSLAGLSGEGLGADLGVTVLPGVAFRRTEPWARRLTFALAARNVLEPSVRLDREAVGDPMTVRAGLGYVHPFAGGTMVRSALELEQPRGASARLHAGVELTLRGVLTLRGGSDAGRLTAGSSVAVRGLSVDYAYEDRATEAVHRIGLSHAFGRTVGERREASRAAEERFIQARLEDGFQKRQDEQVNDLLARAEALRAQGQPDQALEQLALLATLDPGNARATPIEAAAQRELGARFERDGDPLAAAEAYTRVLALVPGDAIATAGLARCQLESGRRDARTAEVRRQFAAAVDALAADDPAEARDRLVRVLALAPGDSTAEAMLKRTRIAIGRRIDALVQQARAELAAGHVENADARLAQARGLDSRHAGLAELADAIARGRRDLADQSALQAVRNRADTAREASYAPSHNSLTGAQRREVEELYRRGLAAMADKRSDDALRYWELASSIDPSEPRVSAVLQREYLMRGMESFAGGQLDAATTLWGKVLRLDPSEPRARAYLARAQMQRERMRELVGKP